MALENAVIAAHDSGIIVVYSAGNDGCSVDDFSPTNIPEEFVVGATSNAGIPGTDRLSIFSRTGWNISNFAPDTDVQLMNFNGDPVIVSGTSGTDQISFTLIIISLITCRYYVERDKFRYS